MRQHKPAYAWLRRNAHPVSSAIRYGADTPAGDTIQESLKNPNRCAAGLDGWSPEELSQFSPDMFSTLAGFFEHCESKAAVPDAWVQIRQVHIGKGKTAQTDRSCCANDLRPIAVSSIRWRVLNNSRYQQAETQEWLTSSIPAWMFGGIPGKGVRDALCPLLKAELHGWTKAFDHGDPRLIHRLLLHLGMPSRTANLLLFQWTHQKP